MPESPPQPLPALHRVFPRIFYGWVVAGGASVLSFVVVGVGFYGMAVFLDGLCQERGWPRTAVSFATTLYFVTVGVSGTAIGRIVDRRGARGSIVVGSLVMAGALVWIGRIETPQQLYLAYPMLAVGFAMTGAVPTGAIITRWFVTRRARAMSVAHTGVSVGGAVLVPLSTALILSDGLAFTTRVLAGLVVCLVVPIALFVLRWEPGAYGLEPDGGAPAVGAAALLDVAAQQRRWTPREALATRTFWLLVAAFCGILFCQVGTAMHQIAFLRDEVGAERAAFAVSTTAFGSIVARLVVGSFADRVSKRNLASCLMLLQACALATFAASPQEAYLFGASLVFGFTIGNIFMLQVLLVGELFGMASFGTVIGLLQLVTQTASGLGPYALGFLSESVGYGTGLALLASVAVVSAGIVSRVEPPAPA